MSLSTSGDPEGVCRRSGKRKDLVAVGSPLLPQFSPKAGLARPDLTMSMYPTPLHFCGWSDSHRGQVRLDRLVHLIALIMFTVA
jgi:hypothetical protein